MSKKSYRKNHGKVPAKEQKAKNRFFNNDYYSNILKQGSLDPFNSIILLEEYVRTYYNDIYSYCSYASLLITVGRFDEAKKVLDELQREVENNKKYNSLDDGIRGDTLLKNLLFIKLRYYIYSGHYEEAYNFILENEYILCEKKGVSLLTEKLFCSKKIGVEHEKEKFDRYLYRQIVEYSEKDFLEHIKRHFQSTKEVINTSESLFYFEFPFERVYENVKNSIPGKEKLFDGIIEDNYYFKYDNCGKTNGVNTNYFVVKVFHDSSDIITMYPFIGADTLPYIDINYLKEEEKPRVRRLSQIDKFNQRYGKK
ncbi:MAG: hypothetical protein E7158_01995 [Firmicutes bacterium]|nr:hypothetical protein [Bacillota bacterium]